MAISSRARLSPMLDSFCGMDLKLGATLISLFAVLNKVAGAYGMLAVLLAGSTALSQPIGQLTMYVYSIASLVLFIWGLQKIGEENGPKSLIYAHLFALDHLVGTLYTGLFAAIWYLYTPHDGRRIANSDAQKAMMGSNTGTGLDDAARVEAAMGVWKSERGFSGAVLVIGWLLKVYFILCLYSYALHVRRGTYSQLPKSSYNTIPSSKFVTPGSSPLAGRSRQHTRNSSTGGPQYSHLRGNSIASTFEGGGTLAETLWEDKEDLELQRANSGLLTSAPPGSGGGGGGTSSKTTISPRLNSVPMFSPSTLPSSSTPQGEPPLSPAFAKGTGMNRTNSTTGSILSLSTNGTAPELGPDGPGNSNGGGGTSTRLRSGSGSENPFASILGRMSGETTR
ncbi:Kei1p [Sporobolomyces koalae]|uniref:Kei1p n=1 Tax=Sporobolomyces koalae TaxID=500713 RepID=UPI003172AE94